MWNSEFENYDDDCQSWNSKSPEYIKIVTSYNGPKVSVVILFNFKRIIALMIYWYLVNMKKKSSGLQNLHKCLGKIKRDIKSSWTLVNPLAFNFKLKFPSILIVAPFSKHAKQQKGNKIYKCSCN